MNRFRYFLRNSLAAKVIVSTLLLSFGVIWLTGSALYSQLSSGVKNVNLDSSLAEARSSFFNAQYQFLLVQDKSTSEINRVTQQVIKSATEVGVNQGQKDIVLLKIEGSASNPRYQGNVYNFSSNDISQAALPSTLREKIVKQEDLVYQYAAIARLSGI